MLYEVITVDYMAKRIKVQWSSPEIEHNVKGVMAFSPDKDRITSYNVCYTKLLRKVNFIIDVKTKDGYIFRIKVIALTHRQLNTSRKHSLRLIARDIINKTVLV